MNDITINAIAAVGKRGQLGLKSGGIPWMSNKREQWLEIDLRIYRAAIGKSPLIAGRKTYDEVADLPYIATSKLFQYDPIINPFDKIMRAVKSLCPNDKEVWIIGGANTYEALKDEINGVIIISYVPYDNDPALDHEHVFLPKQLLERAEIRFESKPIDDSAVIKRWVIIEEIGKDPEKKRPPEQTHQGQLRFAAEALMNRPLGTKVMLANLTWDYDLWVDDAQGELYIAGSLDSMNDKSGEWVALWNKVAAHIDATPIEA